MRAHQHGTTQSSKMYNLNLFHMVIVFGATAEKQNTGGKHELTFSQICDCLLLITPTHTAPATYYDDVPHSRWDRIMTVGVCSCTVGVFLCSACVSV